MCFQQYFLCHHWCWCAVVLLLLGLPTVFRLMPKESTRYRSLLARRKMTEVLFHIHYSSPCLWPIFLLEFCPYFCSSDWYVLLYHNSSTCLRHSQSLTRGRWGLRDSRQVSLRSLRTINLRFWHLVHKWSLHTVGLKSLHLLGVLGLSVAVLASLRPTKHEGFSAASSR